MLHGKPGGNLQLQVGASPDSGEEPGVALGGPWPEGVAGGTSTAKARAGTCPRAPGTGAGFAVIVLLSHSTCHFSLLTDPLPLFHRLRLRVDFPSPLQRPFLGKIQPGGLVEILDRRAIARPGRLDLLHEIAQVDRLPLNLDCRIPFVAVLVGDFEGLPSN